jgi:hypothetical protein
LGGKRKKVKEEAFPITEKNLSERLDKYVDDFIEASKSDVA